MLDSCGNAVSPKPFDFVMGRILNQPQVVEYQLREEDLTIHSCVLGQSGSGKSKFLELLMRYLMTAKRGFALIDPHGDLSEDLLAYAAYRKVGKGDTDLLSRLHYVEPTYEQIFHLDLFRFQPEKEIASKEEYDRAYITWLHAKIDSVSRVVLRKQGVASFEGMTRLQRVLRNVLAAVGTAIGPNGKHLPLSDALVLLDVNHPRHNDVYRRVVDHLDDDIRADFHVLRGLPPRERRTETESTVNWLRSFLSPIVRSIFTDQVETIDFRSIMQNGEILLVNLRETNYFSADQAFAIGGLFIHEILSTAQNTPRKDRKPFYLIVDEAGEFIGPDIGRALGIMRKFKLSICLAAQDLSSFKKDDLDLRPKVLSQCGTVVSFRQTWPEDLDILVRVMCMGNLDFQKYYQVVDRPDGYEFVKIDDYSESFKRSENWSNAFATTETSTSSQQKSTGKTHAETMRFSDLNRTTMTDGSNSGASIGESHAGGTTQSGSTGGSTDRGFSVTHKTVPLSKQRMELHETPSLLNAVNDQFERIRTSFHSLDTGQAIVKTRAWPKAFPIQTVTVDEKWAEKDKFEAIERMKRRIFEARLYCSAPELAPCDDLPKFERQSHSVKSESNSPFGA